MGRALAALGLLVALAAAPAAHAEICPGPPPHECSADRPYASFDVSGDGVAGHQMRFQSTSQANPDRTLTRYDWDFDGDGSFDAEGAQVTHVFATARSYDVRLRVTDSGGATGERVSPLKIFEAPPQALTLTTTPEVTTTDRPEAVVRGRLAPAQEGKAIQLIVDRYPYRDAQDPAIAPVRTAADGSFEFRFKPERNTRVVAYVEWEDVDGKYKRFDSAPLFVWHDWIPLIYKPIRHGVINVFFQPDPEAAAVAMEHRRIWVYWGRKNSRTLRRMGSTRFRRDPTIGLYAHKRLRVKHPRRSDLVFICIRETTDDGFGPPQPASKACGRRRLRF